MSNLRDALFNAGKNATCQVINSPTLGASAGLGLGVEASAILLGPQVGYIYCDPGELTPPPPPPFVGGQCNAIYEFQVRGTRANGTTSLGVAKRAQGPLDIRARASSFSAAGEVTEYTIEILTTRLWTVGASAPQQGARIWRFESTLSANPTGSASTATFEGLFILGGGPDDCGNPAPIIPPYPPGGVTNNFDITYEDNEGNNINVTVPVTVFKPYFDLTGNFSFPISFNVEGNEFNATLKPFGDPEFAFDFNTGGGGGGSTDGTEQPFPPDPNEEFEEPGEESPATIIGVEVFSQVPASAPASSIIFDNGPSLFVPRLGSVAFAIRTPSSVVWTADLPIKNRETYIPCPAPQGAVAVRATPEPGITLRWNAIRSRPLLDVS